MKHVGGKLRPQFRGCVCCVVSDTYLEFRSNVDSLVAKLPARAADVRQTIPLRYVCRTSAVCGWSVTHVMLTEANSYTSSVSFHFRKRTRPLVDCVVSARSAKPQRSPSEAPARLPHWNPQSLHNFIAHGGSLSRGTGTSYIRFSVMPGDFPCTLGPSNRIAFFRTLHENPLRSVARNHRG